MLQQLRMDSNISSIVGGWGNILGGSILGGCRNILGGWSSILGGNILGGWSFSRLLLPPPFFITKRVKNK